MTNPFNPYTMKQFALLAAFAIGMMSSPDVFAQPDNSKYGATEEQQIACMEALSVYKSFKDQDNNKDAYRIWQKACEVCPPDAQESMYIDGVRFIKTEIKESKGDKERIKLLVDSLMNTYDKRMEHFASTDRNPNNRCTILGYKANDYSSIYKSRTRESYEMFKESYECLKAESNASVLSGYYLALFDLFKEAEGDEKNALLSDLLTEYLNLQDYVDVNVKNSSDDRVKEGYEKARNNIDEIFVQIAQCEQMLPVLEQKVAANPDDFELKKKVLRLMNRKDCSDGDFFITVAKEVDSKEPEHSSSYAIGKVLLKAEEYSESLRYMERAVELCGDCADLETYLLRAGQVASVVKQNSKARSYARKVLDINPKNGQALILEGDAIFGMSGQCDDGALGARSVYWLAADYYARARSMDPSVSELASRKIASAASQYPSKEEIFQFTKKEGESFTVPCLGETTTIRAR